MRPIRIGLGLGVANTLSTGVPFRRVIDGVLCERVSLDGVWLTIDGVPVYMEV